MRVSRSDVCSQVRAIPALKFEDQQMTSYGGLVVFQQLFERLGLFTKLAECCRHLGGSRVYSHFEILRCLIIHILIGARRLREVDFYRHDPLVLRVAGLKQLPSIPTFSRMLQGFDEQSVARLQELNRQIILDRLQAQALGTLTLDFDGSVQSTRRHAEGTAVGYNKKRKGERSYYPLFCTIAQTGQAFDVLHRSGNVHDSKGSIEFVRNCVSAVRARLPKVRIEVRLDSAFFSDAMVELLESLKVEYTISVPFERFPVLKKVIAERCRWRLVPGTDGDTHCFQWRWKPQSWARRHRFIFIRNRAAQQSKEPVQLQFELFTPVETGYEFKVVVTNKAAFAGNVARFHEGRGYQEKLYAELKTHAHMDYIPCRRRIANQIYLLSALLVHNLGRELQMQVTVPSRETTQKRTVRWVFEELGTLRRTILQRAGRLTRPQGRLTLTLPDIPKLQHAIMRFLPTPV